MSMGSLFASLVIGAIGFVLFAYGKKQQRMPQLGCGLALMVYPYFISDVVPMIVIAVALIGATWVAIQRGA